MSYPLIDDWCSYPDCAHYIKRSIVTQRDCFYLTRATCQDIAVGDVILTCPDNHFNSLYQCKHGKKLDRRTSKTKKNPGRAYFQCSMNKYSTLEEKYVNGCDNLQTFPDPDIAQNKDGYPKFHPGYWFWCDIIEDKENVAISPTSQHAQHTQHSVCLVNSVARLDSSIDTFDERKSSKTDSTFNDNNRNDGPPDSAFTDYGKDSGAYDLSLMKEELKNSHVTQPEFKQDNDWLQAKHYQEIKQIKIENCEVVTKLRIEQREQIARLKHESSEEISNIRLEMSSKIHRLEGEITTLLESHKQTEEIWREHLKSALKLHNTKY